MDSTRYVVRLKFEAELVTIHAMRKFCLNKIDQALDERDHEMFLAAIKELKDIDELLHTVKLMVSMA